MSYTFSECLDEACITVGDTDLDFGTILLPGGKPPASPPLPVLPAGWRWAIFKTLHDQYLVTPVVESVTPEVRRLFPGAQFTTLFNWGGGYTRVVTSPEPGTTVLPRSERMPRPLYVAYRTKSRDGGPYVG